MQPKSLYLFPLRLLALLILVCAFSQCNNPADPGPDPKPTPVLSGKLQVDVVGLPPSLSADITVTGPNNYRRHFTQSFTIDSLPVGDYTIDAAPVVDSNNSTVNVNPTSQKITIINQQTTRTQVFYQGVDLGSLKITCSGLPPNSAYDVVVVSDFDTTIEFTISQTSQLDSLKVGSYTVTAKKVTGSDGKPYKPKVITVQTIVIKARLSEIGVEYEPVFGKLDILVNGLPSDVNSSIHIVGPEYDVIHGNMRHGLLDSLQEGDYLVIGKEVMGPDFTEYVARPDTQSVKVTAGETTYLTVNYERKYGTLDITVTGLPSGALSIIDVRNSAGKSERYGNFSHMTLDTLPAGFYWVIGNEVKATDGAPWIAKPDTQKVYVTPGDTTFVTVNYVLALGVLKVDVTGLPEGVMGDLVIRNQDFSQLWSITGSEVIDSMPEGVYTVLAHEVVDLDGDTLKPTPDSTNVTITAGDSASVSIAYNGMTFKIFASLHDGSTSGSIVTSHDNSYEVFDTTDYDADLVQHMVWDGCLFTEVDITDSGYARSISGNLREGSFSGAETLAISKQDRSFELTNTSSIRANLPAATYDGAVGANLMSGKGPFLQIMNPNLDTIRVVIHWNVTGTAAATNTGYSGVGGSGHAWMHLHTGSCFADLASGPYPVFNAYMDGRHDNDTAPLTGDTTLVLVNMPQYIVYFNLNTKLMSGSIYHGNQYDGLDGEGYSNASITTVISVSLEK